MSETIYVSQEGFDSLKAKLETANADLKKIRDEKAIAYTATGDTWHDNPYFNKLEQDERNKMQEVSELNAHIANAHIFSVDERNVKRVQLGSIVRLHRYFKVSGQEDELVWEVVGFGETDVKKQKVAYNAPMMQSLMGLSIGDTAEAGSPKGPVEYEILGLFVKWDDVPSNLKSF